MSMHKEHPNTKELSCPVCPLHLTASTGFSIIKKSIHWLRTDAVGYAPLLLRLLLAYEFFDAGLTKLSGDNWFAELSFPFPFNMLSADVNWWLALSLELIAPVALILGLAVRFFSGALIVLTWAAIAAVHWPEQWHSLAELWRGYTITDQGYGNFKLPLMYMMMLISLLFSGAGNLSLDNWFIRRKQKQQNG